MTHQGGADLTKEINKTIMQNSTNSTNNPSAKVKAEVNSFLGSGTYDIVKVTKQVGDRGLEFIAEVRRWNYKHWVNQIVNLSYLFNSTSVTAIVGATGGVYGGVYGGITGGLLAPIVEKVIS